MMRRLRLLEQGESIVAAIGLAMAGIILFVALIGGSWSVKSHQETTEITRQRDLNAIGELLSRGIETMLASEDLSGVRRLVTDAAHQLGIQSVQFVLGDGQVIASSDPQAITMLQPPQHWPPVGSNAGAQVPWRSRLLVRVPGRGTGWLELITDPLASNSTDWKAMAGVGASATVGLLALWFVYRVIWRRLRAVGSIRESLLAISDGESRSGALTVGDALGREAHAWNELLHDLERMRHALSAQELGKDAHIRTTTDLNSICDAMWQGVLLVDDSLNVLYANGAAAGLVGIDRDAHVKCLLGEVFNAPVAIKLVQSVIEENVQGWRAVEIDRSGSGDVVRVSARRLRKTDKASAILFIEDVSQQRVAEAAQQAFVANATHELRMPLTNIRLYVETALDEGEHNPKVLANCLNVINQEARRLERIVGDMLNIAEMESGSMDLKIDDIRIDSLLSEIARDFTAQAEEKGIALTTELAPKLPVLCGDRDKITLAVTTSLGMP